MRLYLSLIFLLVSANFSSAEYDCPVERCRKHGPEIRFPFRLKNRRQAEHCGYPGFDLYCSESKETVMDQPFPVKASMNGTELPYPVKFIVKDIDYRSQLLSLSKVDGCFPGLLPHLNLAASPFMFEHSMPFSFFNCSSTRTEELYHMLYQIPCLSSSDYHVYAAGTDYPSYAVPLFYCTKMFDNSLVSNLLFNHQFVYPIQLRWTKPSCEHCELQGKYCRLKNKSSIHYDTECFTKQLVPGVSKKKIIEGVAIGLAVFGLVSFVLHRVHSFKKKKGDEKRIDQFLEDYKASRPSRYSYADIRTITDNFKEKLGKGGYGTVYKGKLSSDILVAVKVLDNFKGNGEDFVNEVGTIGKIHHVNVVRLLGYCADGYRRGLVYEFLPHDSLEKYISLGNQSRSLGWEKLQEIATGIAKGLDYLHQGCNQRILHFDIKPHNILLDQNFNPKVSDFGLAKLCSKEQSIVSMTAARGTIGYIAPEVFSRNYGHVSYKADIYSFGMLLLDMVGGRRNFHDAAKESSEVYFPEWMYNQLEKGEEIAIQIDKEEDNKIFKRLIIVGLWCIQWFPADRISLKVAIQMIEGDGIPIMPPNPFASTKSTTTNAILSETKFFSALQVISEETKVIQQ